MRSRIKAFGRRFPLLRSLWGGFRWYTSREGLRQVTTAIKHIGWAVQCPFCGWRGNSFYPHPYPHHRLNAVCPRCGSKERHRLLLLYLRQCAYLPNRPIRVLEIAPGPYSRFWFKDSSPVTYISLDYQSPLASCRGDITTLPFSAESFDLAICYHVLEHVVEDRRGMAELRRVLQHDGFLLVQVPIEREVTFEDPNVTDPEERLHLFGQDDHVRAYGADFVERLRKVGFAVRVDSFAKHMPNHVIRQRGLLRDELIYIGNPNGEAEANETLASSTGSNAR